MQPDWFDGSMVRYLKSAIIKADGSVDVGDGRVGLVTTQKNSKLLKSTFMSTVEVRLQPASEEGPTNEILHFFD